MAHLPWSEQRSQGSGGRKKSQPDGEATRRFRPRTEATRERDVHRHLQCWTTIYRPTALNRSAFPQDSNSSLSTPEPCPDTALAAFAQLCALRLHARRCLVTLISSTTEYVLAEQTRSMSSQYDAVDNPKDQPWLGTCSFAREDGINALALDAWKKARRLREQPADNDYYYAEGSGGHWAIACDLRDNRQYAERLFVKRAPWARFYAALPLRSAQGSVLGTITILDDKPRYGVSALDMAMMEDIADTITEHLDGTVVRSSRQRSEKLIQALGLFNNGKNSLREWWQNQEDSRVSNTGRYANKSVSELDRQTRQEFGVRGSVGEQDFANQDNSSSPVQSMRPKVNEALHDPDAGPDTPRSAASASEDTAAEAEARPAARFRRTRTGGRTSDSAAFDLATSTDRTYARAANLLREALGADGVVCCDANIASTLRRFDSTDESDGHGPSASEKGKTSASETDSDSNVNTSPFCKVQGFSTRLMSSANGSSKTSQRFDLSEGSLSRLIKRYPHGHIFNFSDQGDLYSSSEGSGTPTSAGSSGAESRKRQRRMPKDGQRLTKAMPSARTIAFFPLWDETHERWRSCLFVWSSSPLRYYDRVEDITYLSAWGHSLIAELARLETTAADKAKGAFISSVSHELRSPLHGVLAGVEMLLASDLNTFQQEMAHTVSSAGRILLDTVNHILDYSKLGNFTREQKKERVAADNARYEATVDANGNELGVTSNVDLAKLTEEIIESVVSAHRFQYMTRSSDQATADSSTGSGKSLSFKLDRRKSGASELSMNMNFAWRDNWTVKLQGGGWTRIVTNLVGNALKYTSKGSISIGLLVDESLTKTSSDEGVAPAQLIIEDTGVGMSETFLSNDMFTPFKQADSHSTGTGLGLSIVKQIAKDMHMELDISSKLGQGTRVILTFQAQFVSPRRASYGSDSHSDDMSKGTRDLGVDRFHLLTPRSEKSYATHASPTHTNDSSILGTAENWLNCHVSSGPTMTEPSDGSVIYAITEQAFLGASGENDSDLSTVLKQLGEKRTQILVLASCVDSIRLNALPNMRALSTVFVHQPIGPRKLSRAIMSEGEALSPMLESSSGTQYFNRPLSNRLQLPQSPSVGSPSKSKRSPKASRQRMAQSNGEDGSTVSPSPAAEATSAGASDSACKRDTILLVEDNEINMKLLVAFMRKLKLPHESVANGREALDAYRASPSKSFLILMDMSMPVMNGYTATAKIRELQQKQSWPAVMIVALSGVTNAEAKQHAFECGVDEYFDKPVRMVELRELTDRVRTFLGLTSSRGERWTDQRFGISN